MPTVKFKALSSAVVRDPRVKPNDDPQGRYTVRVTEYIDEHGRVWERWPEGWVQVPAPSDPGSPGAEPRTEPSGSRPRTPRRSIRTQRGRSKP
jgi:hypothetical protein